MKIRVEDIGPEGLEVSFEDPGLRPDHLGDQAGAIVRAPAVSLHLTRSGPTVRARGRVRGGFLLVCSRCLGDCDFKLDAEVDLFFGPRPGRLAVEVRLEPGDLDLVYYDSGEIDLGAALRQEMSLALPMAPVCGQGCRGLCPDCGRPLTEDVCGCQKKEIDPRLAKLAQWKTD